ncbi:MAG: hypothetical protein NTY19_44180 [Planctomycetota bacterium]|nr:hypothetical protein [Planctomycetota bacterium]
MGESQKRRNHLTRSERTGMGQLSLVEHALCPLDSRTSLRENLHHESEYRYTDANGRAQTARVVVYCPVGLSSGDEFYLWGLLALALAQPEPQIEFQATPHFCLRELGLISPDSKGGKSYRLFRDALRRLAAVRYQNERFYDPVRREHREVSFGLLSYSLPLDPDSSRAWRIVWDPLFFEYCQAAAGQLSFDLPTYRKLDHASRRLFLLLSKVFWRRKSSPCFDVRHLSVHVLGFSANLATRTLKAKVERCAGVLQTHELLAPRTDATAPLFRKQGKGRYAAQFLRGAYFDRQRPRQKLLAIEDSPLHDPLRAIGFDSPAIARILARFRVEQIQLWADVTLAAVERKGPSFFRRSPQAFFMDNIQHAACGERTPPDWFWELRTEEQRRRADHARRMRSRQQPSTQKTAAPAAQSACPALDLDRSPDELTADLVTHFLSAGQTEADALRNAQRLAEELVRAQRCRRAK